MRAGPQSYCSHLWALVRLAPGLALVPTGRPLLPALIVTLLASPQHGVPSRHASHLSMGPSCAPGSQHSCFAACSRVKPKLLLRPGLPCYFRRCIQALMPHSDRVSVYRASKCCVRCCKAGNALREGCRVEGSECTCVAMMRSFDDCSDMNGGKHGEEYIMLTWAKPQQWVPAAKRWGPAVIAPLKACLLSIHLYNKVDTACCSTCLGSRPQPAAKHRTAASKPVCCHTAIHTAIQHECVHVQATACSFAWLWAAAGNSCHLQQRLRVAMHEQAAAGSRQRQHC